MSLINPRAQKFPSVDLRGLLDVGELLNLHAAARAILLEDD
jgi:hypothetical protein